MSRIKYSNCLALLVVAFLVVGSSSFAIVSSGASCNLTRIQISTGSMTPSSEKVLVTATPSCWSGAVSINRGNVDYNLITVNVLKGQGTGSIVRIGTTQEVHPYAGNPGLRGNNIIIACSCSGTGLTGLSIAGMKVTGSTETISITATPSTWAGSVNVVNSIGNVLASANVPSSPGRVTVSINLAESAEQVHADFSGINSNTLTSA
jgi:hypothetical protein